MSSDKTSTLARRRLLLVLLVLSVASLVLLLSGCKNSHAPGVVDVPYFLTREATKATALAATWAAFTATAGAEATSTALAAQSTRQAPTARALETEAVQATETKQAELEAASGPLPAVTTHWSCLNFDTGTICIYQEESERNNATTCDSTQLASDQSMELTGLTANAQRQDDGTWQLSFAINLPDTSTLNGDDWTATRQDSEAAISWTTKQDDVVAIHLHPGAKIPKANFPVFNNYFIVRFSDTFDSGRDATALLDTLLDGAVITSHIGTTCDSFTIE